MKFKEQYSAPKNLLENKTILVTGAGDGIGKVVATTAAKYGASVILLGKTVHKLKKVYDLINKEGSAKCFIYPLHLEGATPNDYQELGNVLESEFGKLDGLIHNAALLPYLSRIKDYEPDDWMRVMQVNLNGPMLLTQACYDLLLKSENSNVIFTADHQATAKRPFWGAYGVSKGAIENLAFILAKEVEGTNIKVNLVDPGPTLTTLRKNIFPGQNNQDLTKPEDLSSMYLWLLGGEGSLLNGEYISFQ